MFRFAVACLVAAGLAFVSPIKAGEFNKKLSIGDAAPGFNALEGVDGKMYGLDAFKGKDVIVICVTCNHCPVAVAYEDRLIDFAKKYTSASDSKVALVAINVNNGEDDKLPKMKERAKAKGFNFPYIYDPSQKLGRAYGASVTPEFYVLDKDRKIAYMGAMDDSQNAEKVKTNYLEAAVKSLLDGKKVEKAETRPFGCGVQYDK
ncbi:MAG: thioredoxin family protein [Gemmataceae bacterium]|nr:thioredoxin family protein [Gemmataceae bacterium]